MFPAKIKGLNQDTSDESNDETDENPLTKEALEQKTQQRYREALVLQKENKLYEAGKLLQDLLNSDILLEAKGKVKHSNGRIQPSILHLKYCCYLNYGNILFRHGNYEASLNQFIQATLLDDTDLNLWYKIGSVAMKIPNLTFAISAFIETLRRNDRHWPSLDSVITASYAVGDDLACLLYINRALRLDPSFLKGVILRERIFEKHPFLKQDFDVFYPNFHFEVDRIRHEDEEASFIFNEISKLRSNDVGIRRSLLNIFSTGSDTHKNVLKPLKKKTWLCLGKSLLKLYKLLYESNNEQLFFRNIKFEEILRDEIVTENETTECVSMAVAVQEISQLKADSVVLQTLDARDKPSFDLSDEEEEILTELSSTLTSKHNDHDKDFVEAAGGRSKKRKCSPTLADQLKMCDKRRSARNKTVLKSNEPSLSKILRNIISSDLLPEKEKISKSNCYDLIRWNEDSFDTMDIYKLLFEHQEYNNPPACLVNDLSPSNRNKCLLEESYFNTEKEMRDILWYIRINDGQTILELLEMYLKELAAKWQYTWPSMLSEIFVEMYQITLKHEFRSNRLKVLQTCNTNADIDEEYFKQLQQEANVVVLFGELFINHCLEDTNRDQPLGNTSVFGRHFPSSLIGDLHDVCSLLNTVCEHDTKLCIRSYWLEALIFVQKKDVFASCSALCALIEEFSDSNTEIRLPNMKQFHVISSGNARRLLNTLSRNQNLNEVKSLFLESQYDQVIEILEETVKPDSKQFITLPNVNVLSRYQQYNLLFAALWESKKYQDLFKWCEVGCYEAFAIYRKSFFDEIETDTRSKWASLVMNTLNGMLICLKLVGPEIIDILKTEQLSRLVQTLSNVACHQIEASEPSADIICDVVTPWILLANLIDYYEKKNGTVMLFEDDFTEIYVPASISLLFIAHEYLGRRSWCCFDDGALLFYTLNVIEPLYRKCISSSQTGISLSQQVDQIFYCLYSHPFKKNRPRHVQDHSSLGLALTWNRAVQAYSFYKPCTLPMFDAVSKYCTISADTETLMKRMISLIPEEQSPYSVNQFLNGSTDRIPENKNKLQSDVIDLFYLLADYYFKNKIMGKAIKYYLLDICSNPYRIDSWSAMALARGSQLEMKLNSCETIVNECDILKKAELTDKCYKTALELDFSQSSLWIEYGVFCYAIHGFCSRLLKQETTNMSLQMFDMLESRKNQFLETSFKCFSSANDAWLELTAKQEDIQDERWLHHYMLGKIGEKTEENAEMFLSHYYEASKFLHQNGAMYPTRIVYSSPQYYSVEALEIYYRVHASVLKLLETHEEKPLDVETVNTLITFVEKMADSPFVKGKNKVSKYSENGNRGGDKTTKDGPNRGDGFQKNNFMQIICPEVKEILDDILTEVENCTNDVTHRKRKHGGSPLDFGEMTNKKFKTEVSEMNFITGISKCDQPFAYQNGNSKMTTTAATEIATATTATTILDDECVENVEFRSGEKTDVRGTDSSSVESPSRENSDDSSYESSSEISGIEDETEREVENPTFEPSPAEETRQRCWQNARKVLADKCVEALEECIRRFPEHYKSYYRLSHHFFRSKLDKDIEKSRKLLIDAGGLFADRTNKNFFGGIWRIPTGEIDRAGSFAYHMSRSVHLLMDILRDTRDYKTLLYLSNQLRYKPDLDKKYIRDNEREQLCKEAMSLSVQSLRKHVDSISTFEKDENKRKLLLDIYKCYHRVVRNSSKRDVPFGKLLIAMYYKYTNTNVKASLEQVLSFCKSLSVTSRAAVAGLSPMPTSMNNAGDRGKTTAHFVNLIQSDKNSQLLFVCGTEVKVSSAHVKQKSLPTSSNSSMTVAPSIPNNLKNLPAAITVTSVPRPKSAAVQQEHVDDRSCSAQLLSTAPKCRNSVIVRPNLSDEKSKSKTTATAKIKPVDDTIRSSSKERLYKPKHSSSESKTNILTAATSDKKDCGAMLTKDSKITSISSQQSKLISKDGTSHSPKTKLVPDLTIVGKERPSLIITPVCSSARSAPTLQQKLAAKQMANNPLVRNNSHSETDSFVGHKQQQLLLLSNSSNAMDMSRHLGSSGVSIFPVPIDTSSVSVNKYSEQHQCPVLISKVSNDGAFQSKSKSLASRTSDLIDFNNLKTCNKGLIVEQTSSKIKPPQSKASSSVKILDADNPGILITPKICKNKQLEVIALD